MIQMILMILTYIVVILNLNNRMKSLRGNYRTEVVSINLQFTVYLVAYIVRAIFCSVLWFKPEKLHNYSGAVIFSMIYMPENILPATYVLH